MEYALVKNGVVAIASSDVEALQAFLMAVEGLNVGLPAAPGNKLPVPGGYTLHHAVPVFTGTPVGRVDDGTFTFEFNGTDVVRTSGTRALSLAEAKEQKLAQFAQFRDDAAQADVTVQGRTFAANEKVRALFEQLGGRLRRGKPIALTSVYEANGTPVSPVTAALVDAIEDAIAAQVEAAWNKYGQLAVQVTVATTVEAVAAVVW